jgi:hypothetical protein
MATRAVSTVAYVRAWDTTNNAAKTGDSANITLKWCKDGTNATTTNSCSEVDSTNSPGIYKVTLTSTETDCTFGALTGKSSTSSIYIFGVQIGFEYSASAAFPANFTSLSIDGSGRVDVAKVAGTSQTARDIGASVLLSSGTGTGQVSLSSGLVDITQTAADKAWSTAARVLTAGTNIQLPSNGLANVTAWTVALTGNVTGNLSGSVGSVTGAVGSVTGAVGSVTGLTASNLDATISSRLATSGYTAPPTAAQNATAVLTTQMTESYAALHTAPTLAEIVFEQRALQAEKAASGTTLQTKKIDGSTNGPAYTLNSSTSPTSITRAS